MRDPLPLLRFTHDPDRGLRLEDVTRPTSEFNWEVACGALLAHQHSRNELVQTSVTLKDMGTVVPVNVIVNAEAEHEFVEYARSTDGYCYTPIPVATGFGWFSDTPAWMVAHQDNPALLFNPIRESAQKDVQRYLSYYTYQLKSGELSLGNLPWPKASDKPEVLVPECYSSFGQHRRRRRRHRFAQPGA